MLQEFTQYTSCVEPKIVHDIHKYLGHANTWAMLIPGHRDHESDDLTVMKVNGNPLNHGRFRSPQSSANLNFRVLFVLSSFLGDSFFFLPSFLPFFLSLRLEMIYTAGRLQGFAKP